MTPLPGSPDSHRVTGAGSARVSSSSDRLTNSLSNAVRAGASLVSARTEAANLSASTTPQPRSHVQSSAGVQLSPSPSPVPAVTTVGNRPRGGQLGSGAVGRHRPRWTSMFHRFRLTNTGEHENIILRLVRRMENEGIEFNGMFTVLMFSGYCLTGQTQRINWSV